MFSKRRRLLAAFIPSILTTLAALWSAILSRGSSANAAWLPFVYVGSVALVSAVSAYFTQLKPAHDLEKPVNELLAILAEKPMKIARNLGVAPRMNIMLLIGPRFLFGKKRIKVVWGAGMDNFPDVQFVCNHDQGVAGMALANGVPVLYDLEANDPSSLKLPQSLVRATTHLTAIWSWPIYEVDKSGHQTGKLLGVVNLDTTKPGGAAALMSKTETFEKLLRKFCEVASKVV